MTDFQNHPERRSELEYQNLAMARKGRSRGLLWALVAMAFFAMIIIAGHRSERTAQAPPPQTTGQASQTLPAAPAITPASPQPSTIGQGNGQDSGSK